MLLFLPALSAIAKPVSEPEVKQILISAKKYAGGNKNNVFEYKFVKRVNDYAVVSSTPKPKYKHKYEAADIVLQKVNGKWVGKDMGTDVLDDWIK